MLLNFKYLKILNLLWNCNKHVQSLIEKLQNLNLFVQKKKKHQFEVMQMLDGYIEYFSVTCASAGRAVARKKAMPMVKFHIPRYLGSF